LDLSYQQASFQGGHHYSLVRKRLRWEQGWETVQEGDFGHSEVGKKRCRVASGSQSKGKQGPKKTCIVKDRKKEDFAASGVGTLENKGEKGKAFGVVWSREHSFK